MLASTLERHQLTGFRQQLSTRAAALRRQLLAAPAGEAALPGEGVHDTKDQAAADDVATVRRADLVRERAELADVELALARIEAGSYGICCDCARPIGRKRLQAYPTAKRCRACQEAHEQRMARLARS